MSAETPVSTSNSAETFGPRKKTAEQLVDQQARVAIKIGARTQRLEEVIDKTNTEDDEMHGGSGYLSHDRTTPDGRTVRTYSGRTGLLVKSVGGVDSEREVSTVDRNDLRDGYGGRARVRDAYKVVRQEGARLSPDETVKTAAKIAKEQWRALDDREAKAQKMANDEAREALDA